MSSIRDTTNDACDHGNTMSWAARFLVCMAVHLSPTAEKKRREEQWLSDAELAESIGLSPLSISLGAFTTALASFRLRPRSRAAIGAVGIGIGITAVVGTAGSVTAAEEYHATSVYFTSAEQRAAEDAVRQFVAQHPRPVRATASNADWQQQLAAYWSQVPWRAVAAQWDCKTTGEPVIRTAKNADGLLRTSVSLSLRCADPTGTAAVGAHRAETRADYLRAAASDSDAR